MFYAFIHKKNIKRFKWSVCTHRILQWVYTLSKCQVIFSAYFQLLTVGLTSATSSPNSYSLVDSWILLQISDLRIYVGGVILCEIVQGQEKKM